MLKSNFYGGCLVVTQLILHNYLRSQIDIFTDVLMLYFQALQHMNIFCKTQVGKTNNE